MRIISNPPVGIENKLLLGIYVCLGLSSEYAILLMSNKILFGIVFKFVIVNTEVTLPVKSLIRPYKK